MLLRVLSWQLPVYKTIQKHIYRFYGITSYYKNIHIHSQNCEKQYLIFQVNVANDPDKVPAPPSSDDSMASWLIVLISAAVVIAILGIIGGCWLYKKNKNKDVP